jgi:hypothetical protein
MAFVDRILTRMRRRQHFRLGVVLGTIVGAAALTLWLISGLTPALPVLSVSAITAPSWLTASPSVTIALASFLAGLTAWMFTEEA